MFTVVGDETQILLFYPLSPHSQIDIERIDDYYYDIQPNGEKDYNGRPLTVIQTNER